MGKKSTGNTRGKPQEWTDEQLKELAFEVKYKKNGIKLTPSLLQKETDIGRNTWSRRMKDFIDELNQPAMRTHNLGDNDTVYLPSIDLIFQKHGKDKQALKNELLHIELTILKQYNELREYKEKDRLYQETSKTIQALKDEVVKYKKKAKTYEDLYKKIVASSSFPHLYNDSPLLKEHGVKTNLIRFNRDSKQDVDLSKLDSHFPDASIGVGLNDETTQKEQKQNENMTKLLGKFEI